MTSNIIKFPTARIVRRRLGERSPDVEAIDHELWSVDNAIDALRRQRASLIVRYRAAVARACAGGAA